MVEGIEGRSDMKGERDKKTNSDGRQRQQLDIKVEQTKKGRQLQRKRRKPFSECVCVCVIDSLSCIFRVFLQHGNSFTSLYFYQFI